MSHSTSEMATRTGLIAGPVLFVLVLLLPLPAGLTPEGQRVLALTVLMSTWWLTQALPIAATSMVPLAAFPLLGIQSADDVSNAYINKQVFLFLGGFIIALGIEKWGLHERIALHIVRVLGTSFRTVVLGFMLATGFLSMWISNTASALLMAPIAVALVQSLHRAISPAEVAGGKRIPDRDSPLGQFAIALMLGIAWSASIGGVTTLVGTVTNVQFVGLWDNMFPDGPRLSAGDWITAFGPVGLAMILVAWCLLALPIRASKSDSIDRKFFATRLRGLGRPSRAEWMMLAVFVTTAALWTLRKSLTIGTWTLLPGWDPLVRQFLTDVMGTTPDFAADAVHDSTVAIGMALLMFALPGGSTGPGTTSRLMDWETARNLPWDIVLLVGGGFALAGGFAQSGLAMWVGDLFAATVADWNTWALVAAVCMLLTFLTEFTTNAVVVSVLMPVLAASAVRLNVDPRLLMLPAAASASCAFMLPVGTPPNAIVFSSGVVTMGDMARRGFLLNLIGVVMMTLATMLYLVPQLGLSTSGLPDWAQPAPTSPDGESAAPVASDPAT